MLNVDVSQQLPERLPERWTQLSLPRRFGNEDAGGTRTWSFAIVTIERCGRVTLPAPARSAGRILAILDEELFIGIERRGEDSDIAREIAAVPDRAFA